MRALTRSISSGWYCRGHVDYGSNTCVASCEDEMYLGRMLTRQAMYDELLRREQCGFCLALFALCRPMGRSG